MESYVRRAEWGLDKIQDLLLRQESGQEVITSCFQLRFPHVLLRILMSFCRDSIYGLGGGLFFMADRLPWYKGVLLNGCKFG